MQLAKPLIMKLMTTTPNQHSRSLFEDWFNDPFALFEPLFNEPQSTRLAVEWFENDTDFFARLDAPGLTKQDIELEFEEANLQITVKSKADTEQKKVYKLSIPEDIIIDQAGATLTDGVLTVQLPKSPEKQPITIEVQ